MSKAPQSMALLTLFLLARIAEDEEHARGVKDTYGFTPRRLVAEHQAKLQIVEKAHRAGRASARDGGSATAAAPLAIMEVLQHLASIYADHPDYRQEWKP